MVLLLSTSVIAETFTYIVPAAIDGGNAKWAQKFTKEWNKELAKEGHDIILRYVPGQGGLKGFTKYHTEMSDDNLVLVQSKGFFDYVTVPESSWKGFDPTDVDYIGGQLQGTFVFIKSKMMLSMRLNAEGTLNIPYAPNLLIDTMGIYLMLCGNLPTIEETMACGDTKTNRIIGFKGMGSMRMAYLSDGLDVARDGFSHMSKTYKEEIKSGETLIWFTHGTVTDSGDMGVDPNTDGSLDFHKLFEDKHGAAPSGEFYDAYITLSTMRSGLGKWVFTRKDNPFYDVLVRTFNETVKNSRKSLAKSLGVYPWNTGNTIPLSIFERLNDTTTKSIRAINGAIK